MRARLPPTGSPGLNPGSPPPPQAGEEPLTLRVFFFARGARCWFGRQFHRPHQERGQFARVVPRLLLLLIIRLRPGRGLGVRLLFRRVLGPVRIGMLLYGPVMFLPGLRRGLMLHRLIVCWRRQGFRRVLWHFLGQHFGRLVVWPLFLVMLFVRSAVVTRLMIASAPASATLAIASAATMLVGWACADGLGKTLEFAVGYGLFGQFLDGLDIFVVARRHQHVGVP